MQKKVKIGLLGLHHVGRKRRVRELVLGVQERVAVEGNVRVVDALPAQRVPDPLAGHRGRHQGHYVAHAARQLEHYHDQRDRHPGHAAQHGRRPHHGVQPRRDAIVPGRALSAEEPILGVRVRQLLHADAHDSAGDRAQTQAGDEQAAGNLHAEREDGHDQLQDQGEDQQPDGLVDARAGRRYFYRGIDAREIPVVIAAKVRLVRGALF